MKEKITQTLIMVSKYTLIGIVMQAFCISMLMAYETSAQNNVSVKEITLSVQLKNATLSEAFNQIERQTNLKFNYHRSDLDNKFRINYSGVRISAEELLLYISKEAGLKFKQVNENVNVSKISNSNHETPLEILIQSKEITGKITSIEDGEGLPGVNIIEKGTNNGTVSDVNGAYKLVVSDDAVIVFSSVGYVSEEVPVSGRSVVNMSMYPDVRQLQELVVVGYGTVKKSDVTGAIIRVDESELRSRPVVNAFEAIQGKAAGVDITSNERPGELGRILIRGVRSLSAGNGPLYVVDDVPLMSRSGIETLNPADIESIDILKDASATAIYGSRGANGVILITTKKGKEGKMSMNYSGSLTFENILDRTEMMDAGEYLTWRRWAKYYEAVRSDPNSDYPRGDQPTIDNDRVIFYGDNDPSAWNNIMRGWEGGVWDGSKVKTTDWAGIVTQTGVTQDHSISASGGSDKIRAYGSFGYLDNQGTMKGQYFTRYTSKVSVDITPLKWFEMGASVSPTYSIQQYGQSTTAGTPSGPNSVYAAAIRNLPFAVPYDSDGNRILNPGGDDLIRNVVNEWNYTDNIRKMFRTLGNVYAQLNILPGLRYRINFGPDFRYYTNGIYVDKLSVNSDGSDFASLRNQHDFSWTLDNLVYYDKRVGVHSFGATLLQTSSSWYRNSSSLTATGLPLASQKWNALGAVPKEALDGYGSALTESQLMSYMARLNYSLSEKYLLTVSGRWDGASQLAEGHKWAFFPSAALGWRLDQEDWIKSIGLIDQLKVRLGVGSTGNSAIREYDTKGSIVSMYYPYGNTQVIGYSPYEGLVSEQGELVMANKALGWEMTTQYNLGFDFSVLNNRISGIFDLYTSSTSDLLLEMNLPSPTGYRKTWGNIGETKNVGLDVTLNSVNIKTDDLIWETSLNAAWQKDQIVSLANGKEDDILNTWFIGQPISHTINDDIVEGVIYGYESNGLWKEEDLEEMLKFNANGHKFSPGMSRPIDQNGDYKIDPNDDRVIIGHTRPRWTVGMTNSLTYKNFDLSIFLYGRLKYMYNTGGEWQGGRYTQRVIDYYNENNKDAEYQKPVYDVAGGDPYHGVLGYREGSFVKVRSINLGYTLPKSLTSVLGMEYCKVYVQAKNPGMLYSKIDWLDLDLGGSTWNRGFVFGVNVGF